MRSCMSRTISAIGSLRRARDDLGGCRHDRAAGAIVAREAHDLAGGIVMPEAVEAGGVGAAEAVDRLIGIADDAEIAVGRREQGQQAILLLVDVLEFVDRDPAEAIAVERGQRRIRRQGADRQRDEIVEVDPVALRERAAIGCRRLRGVGAGPALRALLLGDGAQEPLGLVRGEIERLREQRRRARLRRRPGSRAGARPRSRCSRRIASPREWKVWNGNARAPPAADAPGAPASPRRRGG